MSTCVGYCCEWFTLGWYDMTPQKFLEEAARGGEAAEAIKIFEPLIRLERVGGLGPTWYYHCTKYDRKNRLCTIYETRPKLCRDYPGRSRCGHSEGCSYINKDKYEEFKYEECVKDEKASSQTLHHQSSTPKCCELKQTDPPTIGETT